MNQQNEINLDVKKLVTDAFASSYSLITEQGHRVHIWYKPRSHTGFLERFKNQQGFVTLNLTPESVNNLSVSDNYLSFQARFNNKVENLLIALDEIEAIIDVDAGAAIPYPFTSFFIQLTQILIAERSGVNTAAVPVSVNENINIDTSSTQEQEDIVEKPLRQRGWTPRLIIGGKK